MKNCLLFILLALNFFSTLAQDLSKNEIKTFADKMLLSKNYKIQILKTYTLNNVCVASIEPPYREFPSILIFRFNKSNKKWVRVFEGLNPGIQDSKSNLLDLHTKKVGMDFLTNKDTLYEFSSEQVRKIVNAMSKQNGAVLIPYQKFLHFHSTQSEPKEVIESYTIDKTEYHDFAIKLIGNRYWKYPKGECMMYDTPKIGDFEFTYQAGIYKIVVETSNKQVWTYTFKDVDASGMYLVGKEIKVMKSN